jgi:hypothetical protein
MNVNRRWTLSNRGGSSVGGFLGILAVAVVGGGLYVASRQQPEKRPVASDDKLVQVAALARAEKEAEWLQRAIRERQAILGMTSREVENARGQPAVRLRANDLSDIERAKGAVEKWVFRDSANVLFGATGLVIYSSDVGDTPQPGQIVRQ